MDEKNATPLVAGNATMKQFSTVSSDDSIGYVVEHLPEQPNASFVYVTDGDGRLLGHIDFLALTELFFPYVNALSGHALTYASETLYTQKVERIVNRMTPAISGTTPLPNVLLYMLSEKVEEVAVIDEERTFLGSITIANIMKVVHKMITVFI